MWHYISHVSTAPGPLCKEVTIIRATARLQCCASCHVAALFLVVRVACCISVIVHCHVGQTAFTEGTVNMHKKNFTYSGWYKLVGRLRQTEQTGGHLLTELQEVELCEALVAGHNAERALALAQLDDDRLVWIIQVDHMRWLRSDH